VKIAVETTVNAPLDKVWLAYITPADILQWNAASEDWHTTEASVEFREGGEFSSHMEAKDGSVGFDFAGTYTKIIPHERIEYAFGHRTAAVDFASGKQGVTVRVTSVERTVADCFKFRNKIGVDVAMEALREAWMGKRVHMDELWRCATLCRVANVMRPYMESLS